MHSGFVIPAYADVWLVAQQEQQLPVNVDPLQANLDDPDERRRLARVLVRGLGEPAGYVLPLEPARRRAKAGRTRWRSSRWPLRREHLYLVAGDSPVGLRLPLSALPCVEVPAEPPNPSYPCTLDLRWQPR